MNTCALFCTPVLSLKSAVLSQLLPQKKMNTQPPLPLPLLVGRFSAFFAIFRDGYSCSSFCCESSLSSRSLQRRSAFEAAFFSAEILLCMAPIYAASGFKKAKNHCGGLDLLRYHDATAPCFT